MARAPQNKNTAAPPGMVRRFIKLLGRADAHSPPNPWLPADARYPRLRDLAPDAAGLLRQTGLFACWHLGVRPRWVRIGGAKDLGMVLMRLKDSEQLTALDVHGGLYVAWAFQPAAAVPAVLAYLLAQLAPAQQAPWLDGEIPPAAEGAPFPFPPGTILPAAVQENASPQS